MKIEEDKAIILLATPPFIWLSGYDIIIWEINSKVGRGECIFLITWDKKKTYQWSSSLWACGEVWAKAQKGWVLKGRLTEVRGLGQSHVQRRMKTLNLCKSHCCNIVPIPTRSLKLWEERKEQHQREPIALMISSHVCVKNLYRTFAHKTQAEGAPRHQLLMWYLSLRLCT